MTTYDVFNGDADGICSLLQLRLDAPKNATLITGVKRDINLLDRLDTTKNDKLTVLDISMLKNQAGLNKALAAGTNVFYADHHQAGDIPVHPNLSAHINLSPDICTGLIINGFLNNRFILWALTAAYGDNLIEKANTIGANNGIHKTQLSALQQLGTYLNYNGYGATIEDLLFHPADLFTLLLPYTSPLDFIEEKHEAFDRLETGYNTDLASAENATVVHQSSSTTALLLPNQPWARRVSGVFGNRLANQHPNRAHAILTEHHQEGQPGYVVSIRAPINNKKNADTLASQFPSGGGRKGAAGINFLAQNQLEKFLTCFNGLYP